MVNTLVIFNNETWYTRSVPMYKFALNKFESVKVAIKFMYVYFTGKLICYD